MEPYGAKLSLADPSGVYQSLAEPSEASLSLAEPSGAEPSRADTRTDVYFSSRFPAKLPNGLGDVEDESQTYKSAETSPGLAPL